MAHQSFAGAIEGVYPYGVDILLVIAELYVLGVLILTKPSLGNSIAVCAVSLFAILLNEKGGIVGATYIAGSILRMPGGSVRGAAFVLAAYVAVILLRLNWFAMNVGDRGFAEAPAQLLFDFVAPALNVLISDPRFGKWRTFPQAFVWGYPWAIITIATSLLILGIILAWVARRQTFTTELKVAALLPVVLGCSAIFGPFSNKDYIPMVALPVYALTSFYAMRWFYARHLVAGAVVGSMLFAGWSIRTVGLFYYMHRMAYDYRDEWIDGERHARFNVYSPVIGRPILERLRAEATSTRYTYTDDLIPAWLAPWLRGRGCPEFCN